jgi:hypothetical protein
MLVYGVVSIAILAFSYFVIIKPITDSTNDTVNNALQQSNQALKHSFGNPTTSGGGGATQSSGSGGSSSGASAGSSGGSATATSVYNACIDAINNNPAGKSGCVAAKGAFQQCSDQVASLSGSAKTTAANACQTAANQTVAALKSAG